MTFPYIIPVCISSFLTLKWLNVILRGTASVALLHVSIVSSELHQTWWSSTSEYFIFAQQQLHFPLTHCNKANIYSVIYSFLCVKWSFPDLSLACWWVGVRTLVNLTKSFFRLMVLEKYSNHISTQAEESSRHQMLHQPMIHALVAPLGRCRCKHVS